MVNLQEILNELKLFLWDLEDCDSRENMVKIKENINNTAEKLCKSPEKDYSDIGQSITPIKFMFGTVSLRLEIDFSVKKIQTAINILNEIIE